MKAIVTINVTKKSNRNLKCGSEMRVPVTENDH